MSTNSDVLLISGYRNSTNSFLASKSNILSPVLPNGVLSSSWMCTVPEHMGAARYGSDDPTPDPLGWSIRLEWHRYFDGEDQILNPFPVEEASIQYCLSQPVEEQCKTQFSLGIMITILICNLIKVACMGAIVWQLDSEPLVTFGDAVASFLAQPDLTTKDIPLYGRSRFKDSVVWDFDFATLGSEIPRWYRSISKRRWLVCNSLCLITLIVACSLLGTGLNNSRWTGHSIPYLWSLGFGNVKAETVIGSMNFPGPSGLVSAVLLANLPQVVLSFLYFAYNGIFTCMLLTQKWTQYASKRKPLRVSSPKGVQRGTYYLQLPYRYGLPLLICSGLLHWLTSQSIFLPRIDVRDTFGNEVPSQSISTCGYSPMAIILVTVVGFTAVLVGIGNGFRKHKAVAPLARSCGAIISAACHPPDGSIDTTLKLVKWEKLDQDEHHRQRSDLDYYSFT